MSDVVAWTKRDRVIRRREWAVPLYDGRCVYANLLSAIQAAESARAVNLVKPVEDLSDDALMVSTGDDEIVIWFETDEVTDR